MQSSLKIDDVIDFMFDSSYSKKMLMGNSALLSDIDLIKIGDETGYEIFDYEGKSSVYFDSLTKENEFHFDGISSPNHSRVPNFLLFEFIKCDSDEGRNPMFKLLDCEHILYDLDDELKSTLSSRKLVIKGHLNPAAPKFSPDFSFYSIQEIFGRQILRMHLPSANPDFLEVRKSSVYSINENIEVGIEGLSGLESYNIFMELHRAIESSSALIKFRPKDGLLLILNNNFCFHGREAPKLPSSRLLRRTQYFKGLK